MTPTLLLVLFVSVWTLEAIAFERSNGDDLHSFVTMPEARPMKFNVTYHDRSRVDPGLFFVAPYWNFIIDAPVNRWIPCQMGPHIYDANGDLVWTGACQFGDHNVFDFKMTDNIDDQQYLTFVKAHSFTFDNRGEAHILDHHYEVQKKVGVTNQLATFDTHEFRVLDGGRSALATQYRGRRRSFADFGRPMEESWVIEGGLLELDIETGKVLYDWNSADEISLNESFQLNPDAPVQPNPEGYDFFHPNSVDKDGLGNYLLSGRYMNTIYYISATEHRILWRLGGKKSDFTMDFTFSGQHHARFRYTNSTHMILSFFDNGGVDEHQEESSSSGLIVLLDLQAKTATRLQQITRPDGGLTVSRGNFAFLPNGNYLLNWVNGGYMTEFSATGDLLMEARFHSDRYSTYRAYKFDFHGQPRTPPAVVAQAYGSNTTSFLTAVYVSWNGATDVAQWVFYAQRSATTPPIRIGYIAKTGFESLFSTSGYLDWISVEGVDRNGVVLGRSEVHRTRVPGGGDDGEVYVHPDDPEILYPDVQAPAPLTTPPTDATPDTNINTNTNTIATSSRMENTSFAFFGLIFCISCLGGYALYLLKSRLGLGLGLGLEFGCGGGGGGWKRRYKRLVGSESV